MNVIRRIYRSIYHSIRNVLLYRVERMPASLSTSRYLREQVMKAKDGKEQLMLFITNYMLLSLGMRVSNEPGDLRFIYLTRRQREVLAKARDVGGYNIDLL